VNGEDKKGLKKIKKETLEREVKKRENVSHKLSIELSLIHESI
jgi:hypothetical protein